MLEQKADLRNQRQERTARACLGASLLFATHLPHHDIVNSKAGVPDPGIVSPRRWGAAGVGVHVCSPALHQPGSAVVGDLATVLCLVRVAP